MGEKLILIYRQRLKKEQKLAFFFTFVTALLIHIYKFTNNLPNNDTVFNYYSYQDIVKSGRWALAPACAVSSFFDLPWIDGVLSCVYIALTVVVVITLFKVNNPIIIFLVSGIIAASPATTQTFFYEYTADGYMLAMLLAAVSVYLSRFEEKRISRLILSAVLVCLTCAIYQAYVSFALILAICYFIQNILANEKDNRTAAKWILRQAIIYVSALAAYYVIWKIILRVGNYEATDYFGISSLGITASTILNGIRGSISGPIKYFIRCNPFIYGWSLYAVLGTLTILTVIAIVILSFFKSKTYKRGWHTVFFICALAAILPVASMWLFTSSELSYYPRMYQSINLLLILAVVLVEKWGRPSLKNIVCLLFALVVFDNSLSANICYYQMTQSYENTYAEALMINTTILDYQREYGVKKIAILGTRENVTNSDIDYEAGKIRDGVKLSALSNSVCTTLIIDGEHAIPFLQHTFGMDLEVASSEEQRSLWRTEEVQNMTSWPQNNSVEVIGDTLVIKLSDKEADLRKTKEDERIAASRAAKAAE